MLKFNPTKTKYLSLINSLLDFFYHTPKSTSEIEWGSVKSILLIDFTGIGDLVMLIPFIRVIKKNAPLADIDLACNGYGELLLGEQELIRDFYCIDGKKYINNIKKLIIKDSIIRDYLSIIKENQYDLIIEPRGDLRYIYFMHLLNGQRKISYNYTGGESLLTDVIKPNENVSHLLEDKMVFLKKIGCRFDSKEEIPYLKISKESEFFIEQYKKTHQLSGFIIGIHPGASQELRRWDKYPILLKKIFNDNPLITVLAFSSKGEESYAEELKNTAIEIGCNLIVVNETLTNYIKLISLCSLMICNDSGAAHIAAAYGIPTVVLYGPNIPEFSSPTGKNVVLNISNDLPCKPCGRGKCRYQTNQCIRSITVEQVYEETKKLIT